MSDFARDLMAIAVAQELNMIGVDRMHHSTLQVLIDLTQEYLMLLAKKTMREAESCSRTKPCILDVIGTLDYVQVLPKDLSDYIAAVTAKKEKTRAPFTFPRPEPAHFPTSKSMIEGMENVQMDVDETDAAPMPPLPTEKDELLLEELLQEAQVPSWETQVEELIPQTAIAEMKPSESLYYRQISFEEAQETILKDYVELPAPAPKDPKPEFDMDQLLFETFENFTVDTKTRPPMAPEDLLTLFSFKTNYGVAIPSDNTSGYESKSMINDLLILRLPALHTLFGGERILDHEIRVQEELASLQKGRKREKERDSGQGKAPVKMSAAKLAKKRAQDIAAGRIPADEIKPEDTKSNAPDTSEFGSNRGSEPPQSATPSMSVIKESPLKSPAERIDCLCANPKADYGLFMIACDDCQVWYHGTCVNITQELPSWICSRCK